jgi:hypothetical protein
VFISNLVTHTFHYNEKPATESTADLLLTPARYLFGGRTISVVTGEVNNLPVHEMHDEASCKNRTMFGVVLAIAAVVPAILAGVILKLAALIVSPDCRNIHQEYLKQKEPGTVSWISSFIAHFSPPSDRFKEYDQVLEKMRMQSDDDNRQTPLHHAVLNNDLAAVTHAVEYGAQIDAQDLAKRTPLWLAVSKGNFEIVKFLLSKNANPEVVDESQVNIVELAKTKVDGVVTHTPLSKYLKRRIEIDKIYLESLSTQFQHLVKEEQLSAKKQGKKVLILLGELHGNYKLHQLKKALLKVAFEADISCLYTETSTSNLECFPCMSPIQRIINKNNYKISIEAVDSHPNRENASDHERNMYIKNNIVTKNSVGTFLTGCAHLQGLLEDGDATIPRSQYLVIPINLTSFLQNSPDTFAADASKVIQLCSEKAACFTNATAIISHWNG